MPRRSPPLWETSVANRGGNHRLLHNRLDSFADRTPSSVDGFNEGFGASVMNQKLFIISLRCGRLANRLVLFANLAALAEETRGRVANPTFLTYADLFETTRRDIYCRYPAAERQSLWNRLPGMSGILRATRLPYRLAQAARNLNEKFPGLNRRAITLREIPGQPTTLLESEEIRALLSPATLVFVCGWRFRAPNYLGKHAAAVRRYFRPVPGIVEMAARAVEPLRQKAELVVGVHIRHGDYRTFKKGQYFFPVESYAAWLRSVGSQLAGRKVAFLVCSDEPRTRAEFPGLDVGFGTNNALADLYALAACDYVMGPPSTFTQWASYYGDRPMLHLESREDSVELDKFKVSDLYRIP